MAVNAFSDSQVSSYHLQFAIHKDLKDFYSRDAGKDIKGIVNFTAEKFVVKTGDERNDTWFSFNSCEGKVEYTLELLSKTLNML